MQTINQRKTLNSWLIAMQKVRPRWESDMRVEEEGLPEIELPPNEHHSMNGMPKWFDVVHENRDRLALFVCFAVVVVLAVRRAFL